jgi:uncharacterized protein YbjT (DUF2867 family)
MADLRLDARLRCSALIRRPPASSGRAPTRRIRASDPDIWRAGVARVAFRLHILQAMGKSGSDAAGGPEVDDQERAAMREFCEGNDKLCPVSIARAPRSATSIRKR